MTNILTAAEAANVIRCLTTDPLMLQLLPQVDAYIITATGRDWTADSTIEPVAKAAAQMLITLWHEDPAMMGRRETSLGFGLYAALSQLEAKALILESSGVPDEALALVASVPKEADIDIADAANLVLIFNHAMDSTATSAVTLKDANGNLTTVVNSLDVTKKILTVNPTGSLTADTKYTLVITAAADVYGNTYTHEIGFTTA